MSKKNTKGGVALALGLLAGAAVACYKLAKKAGLQLEVEMKKGHCEPDALDLELEAVEQKKEDLECKQEELEVEQACCEGENFVAEENI